MKEITDTYIGSNRRAFERKMLETGILGYLKYFGQNNSEATISNNEVYPVTILDINLKGVGLEIALPKKRKNHEIDMIRVSDNFTLYYVISKKHIQIPKIEAMKVVNINKIKDENSPNLYSSEEIFQIGAQFFNNNDKDEFGFVQSSIIDMRHRVPDHEGLVKDIFGISQSGRSSFLPKKLDLEKNLKQIGQSLF